jgi:hypothetical protein
LLHRHLQSLTFPQTLNTFVIHLPACVSQQGSNPTIAISTVLTRQFDHVCDQPVFVITPPWYSPLCRSVLAQDATSAALRNLHLAAHMIYAGTSA